MKEKFKEEKKETSEYLGRENRPIVPGSEYEDIVNRQHQENEYDPKESEQRHLSRQRKEFMTPERISNEETYDSRFVSESDATDEEILDEIIDAGLSTDDLSIETLRGMTAKERNELYKEFGKLDGHSFVDMDVDTWEKNYQKSTDALLEKLPYEERKCLKDKIEKVRDAHRVDHYTWKNYSGRQRYLHSRAKNKELNQVLQKYFSVKEGERLDFGKEESWKYEPTIDVKRRGREEKIEREKEKIEKKVNEKYWMPWKEWKKLKFWEKHRHTKEKTKEAKSEKLKAELADMEHYEVSYSGSSKEDKKKDWNKSGWKGKKNKNSRSPRIKKLG